MGGTMDKDQMKFKTKGKFAGIVLLGKEEKGRAASLSAKTKGNPAHQRGTCGKEKKNYQATHRKSQQNPVKRTSVNSPTDTR